MSNNFRMMEIFSLLWPIMFFTNLPLLPNLPEMSHDYFRNDIPLLLDRYIV